MDRGDQMTSWGCEDYDSGMKWSVTGRLDCKVVSYFLINNPPAKSQWDNGGPYFNVTNPHQNSIL